MSYTVAQWKQIQTVLQKAGNYLGKIDGIAGPYTINAVKSYQKQKGLVVDGVVGPITLKKMGLSFNTPKYATTYLANYANAVGDFSTIKEAYNNLIGKGYSYYYNDIYNQSAALARLKARSGINCTDSCQLFYQVAKDLGYSVRYVHIKCASGGGHIQLDVKGKDLGSSWIRIDPAAALSVGTKAAWGVLWCNNGKVLAYDEPWLISDDGKT